MFGLNPRFGALAANHQRIDCHAAFRMNNHRVDVDFFEYLSQSGRNHGKTLGRRAESVDIQGRPVTQSVQQGSQPE